MADYRISFFKHLVNSDGRPFKCLQRQFEMRDMRDAGHAAQSAARRFEELCGVRGWQLRADTIEVEPAGGCWESRPTRDVQPRKKLKPPPVVRYHATAELARRARGQGQEERDRAAMEEVAAAHGATTDAAARLGFRRLGNADLTGLAGD